MSENRTFQTLLETKIGFGNLTADLAPLDQCCINAQPRLGAARGIDDDPEQNIAW